MTLLFLQGQARYMARLGIELAALSSPGSQLEQFGSCEGVAAYEVEMPRRISPMRDLAAVWAICRTVTAVRPDIVHSHTPKGGLLGMIAAWLCRVPARVYHVHGLPYQTASGVRRRLLWWTEWVSCKLAHRVLCVSDSVRRVAVEDDVCPPWKAAVPARGSISGVDADVQFNPGRTDRAAARAALQIPPAARVVGFVGRVVRDKGVEELAAAWQALREEMLDLHLLVVGPEESQDAVAPDVTRSLRSDPRVRVTGECRDTPPMYAAMDLFVLPTHREGFGVVNIEAAAMGLPVVSTRVAGCVDSVADGVTGTLVPPRCAPALADAMRQYLSDPDLRRRHGAAGRERVLREFRQELVWDALYREYAALLEKATSRPRQWRMKRVFDVFVAATALLALSPVMGLVALGVATTMGRPVLFRQTRPGYLRRPFDLFKFRTMAEATGPGGEPLPDGRRITRLGRFLRSTSLDELPELWNVLKGDMSLVGPRPLLTKYLPYYSEAESKRFDVRPGITGWAQVHGRNDAPWDRRLADDAWYVENQSLALDLKILWLTVRSVLRRQNVQVDPRATMLDLDEERRQSAALS